VNEQHAEEREATEHVDDANALRWLDGLAR
jgi:hypothetical protein